MPVNEVPLERPHLSPFLRSVGLELALPWKAGAPLGSRAAGVASPQSLEHRKRHSGQSGGATKADRIQIRMGAER